jgi:hypothetical protein
LFIAHLENKALLETCELFWIAGLLSGRIKLFDVKILKSQLDATSNNIICQKSVVQSFMLLPLVLIKFCGFSSTLNKNR